MAAADSGFIRKAWVLAIDAANQLGLRFQDWGGGGAPVARPFVGGAASGFHAAPRAGDQVAVLHEQFRHPVGAVSITDTPLSLPALAPGECTILHADGRVAINMQNGGLTVLFRNGAGTMSVTADPATGRISLVAPNGIWANGQRLDF